MVGLADAAGCGAADQPDREPRRAEQHPGDGAGQRALGGALADHVARVVDVHVAPGERAADHDPVVPVVLDEGDLVDPGRGGGRAQHIRVGAFRAADVIEDHECQIEAHAGSLARRRPGRIT